MELRFLRQFMTDCLAEWHQYVEDRRSEYYELNYYTTEQLVLLRQSLAKFAQRKKDSCPDGESENIDYDLLPQVYVLLSNVKSRCIRRDIEDALKAAAKDILKPPVDDVEQAEHAEAAAKQEAAKNILQELKDEFEIEEKLAWASIKALGQGLTSEEYMNWCIEHGDDEDLIRELTSSLNLREDDDSVQAEDEDDIAYGFPSQTKTFKEVTSGLLEDIVSNRYFF